MLCRESSPLSCSRGLGMQDAFISEGLMDVCFLQVYTFGAPRPGNRAFRMEYDQLVPDTWQVINDAVRGLVHPP